MRNRHPGFCYRCGRWCAAGEGHFERTKGRRWRVQHADCAVRYRGTDHRSRPIPETHPNHPERTTRP